MKSRTLQLPETVYEALQAAALAEGLTPSDWLAAHVPGPAKAGPETAAAPSASDSDAWLDQCIVIAPHAVGSDDQRIDADLAGAYSGQLASKSPPGEGA